MSWRQQKLAIISRLRYKIVAIFAPIVESGSCSGFLSDYKADDDDDGSAEPSLPHMTILF